AGLGVPAAGPRRPHARPRRRRGLGRAAEPRPFGDRQARVRRRRRARAPVPRRLGLRVPVAFRRLRDPDRRGDGERRPRRLVGARVDGRGLRGRGLPCRPGERGGVRGRDRAGARRSGAGGGARPRARAPVLLARHRRGVPARLPGGGRMRVGLDVSPLAQTAAGTARYLESLEAVGGVELVRLAHRGRSRADTVYRDAVWYPLVLPRLARDRQLDVLHCPTFRGPLGEPGCPLVVTFHDLAVLRHPETFNLWTRLYSRLCVSRVARAARLLIAVSEHTKRDVVELLGVPEERIRVVPNGVADAFTPEGSAEAGDYVLAVGTIEPRKNLGRLAEATRRLGVELRVVGAPGWGRVELGPGVRRLGRVPDDELARLYRGARCLAYPSLYEGFGIPNVEAMASGTPVVTSGGGATEEISGGAAVLVDPLDPASIAAGIEEASARREELVRAGLQRARDFGWDEVARRTAEVYRAAAA